jgi:hypothetical protein
MRFISSGSLLTHAESDHRNLFCINMSVVVVHG